MLVRAAATCGLSGPKLFSLLSSIQRVTVESSGLGTDGIRREVDTITSGPARCDTPALRA